MTSIPRTVLGGAACFLIVLIGFLWWTDQPSFRYGFVGNSKECSTRQMARLPTDLEFVAIGSSRVRRGIDEDFVVTASEGQIGRAFNLGRPWRNIMRSYTMFADVVERNANLKYAYIEMSVEIFTQKLGGRVGVRDDIGIMRYRDILLLYHANSDASQVERFHIVAQSLLKKVGSSLTYLFSGDAFEHYPQAGEEAESVCWMDGTDDVDRRDRKAKAAKHKAMKKKYGPLDEAVIDTTVLATLPRATGELYFLDQIRQLAADHGVKLIVSRHWGAYQPPYSDSVVRGLRQIIPEFAYPSTDFVRNTWDGFIDDKHMGPETRQDFTRWMLSELLPKELVSDTRP